MSLQALNDENLSIDITAETCDFLFTPPQPTGRPSILRPSQKDNLPPKSPSKGMKVTFQTPMRDPQTHRIVNSGLSSKPDSLFLLENCTQALEQLHLSAADASSIVPEETTLSKDPPSHPEDEAPVKSNGAYSIDFDKLDEINPFKSTKKMQNSPVKPDFDSTNVPDSLADLEVKELSEASANSAGIVSENLAALRASPDITDSPVTVQFAQGDEVLNTSGKSGLDDTVPLTADTDVQESLSKSTAIDQDKNTISDEKEAGRVDDLVDVMPASTTEGVKAPQPDVPSSPPLPKGSYKFDPDQLDSMDPFNTGGSKLQNSPKKPVSGEGKDDKAEPVKLEFDFGGGDAPLKTPPKKLGMRPPLKTAAKKNTVSDEKEAGRVETIADVIPASTTEGVEAPQPDVPSSPPLPKGSYKFDPDQLDSMDPFNTGGSKLQNSPKKPVSGEGNDDKAEPVKLEFDFGGGDAPLKPPPKKLGKRPPLKTAAKKPVVPKEAVHEKPKEQDHPKPPEEDVIVPKVSYNFDWNKFEDPNFNPFGCGGSKIVASPKVPKIDSEAPIVKKEDVLPVVESAAAEKTEANKSTVSDPAETPLQDSTLTEDKSVSVSSENTSEEHKDESTDVNTVEEDKTSSVIDENPSQIKAVLPDSQTASNTQLGALDMDFNVALDLDFKPAEEMEFKPATEVFTVGFDQPIEIDYLENFGMASFKDSALRKQSLFLKFDPLLRESPKKSATTDDNLMSGLPQCNSLEFFGSFPQSAHPSALNLEIEEKPRGLDLLGTFTVADTAPLIPDSTGFRSAPDPFLLPPDVGAIVEVLKFSQKDMDAAIETVRLEVREKDLEVLEWKNKHEKLYLEYVEMGKIIAEFESTIAQILADSQRQKEMMKRELNKVLEEKQQVQNDLNSMENSFSELFKRLEKQKDALEGYRKNEEALKKCVEDYLARIKKEEQRYQALKAHAEEKLSRANEEIAQVRSKFKSESTALQATLRREQMKSQSLERALEQKTKENDELTKICDDLILKMEKI
ncbi:PREDICTED: transforming acidic coiled-coil-containing protein 3 [Nanorana parkeri]|uniref:transforming acidic coiled-coil-containing protein 3 n=1 Tax=Nanorana parkeri TaxID=125878 RepID=UPI0008542EBF|nr:PREDICTED: transforming acidic coiled-coil-containing protein 3 [Nanorana parkeri]